ncbi:MAG: metal-dependent hydrolase [bacterium]|nr:metal-dependent hydrolase [bacterium]
MDTHTHGLIAFNLWLWIWYAKERVREYFTSPLSIIIAFSLAVLGATLPDYVMIYAYIKKIQIESLIGSPVHWNLFATWWVIIPTMIFHSIPIALAVIGTLALAKRLRPYMLPLAVGWLIGHIAIDYLTHTDNAHRYFWPLTNSQFAGILSRNDPRITQTLPLLSVIEWCLWAVLGPLAIVAMTKWLRTLTFKTVSNKTPGS